DRHGGQHVRAGGPNIGAVDHTPAGAVPLLDQRLGIPVFSHGPDVRRRHDGHAVRTAAPRPAIGARGYVRAGAGPVLDQRLLNASGGGGGSHSPDVGGRDDGHGAQHVRTGPDIGAVDHVPAGAVPLLGQGLPDGAIGDGGGSHSPDIGGRDGGYPVQ